MINTFTALLAIVLGATSVLGWAPFAIWPIPIVAFAALAYLVAHSHSVSFAGMLGLAFATGQHAAGHGWVMGALDNMSGLSTVGALLSTGFFVLYLSIFSLVPCLVWRVLIRRSALLHVTRTGDAAGHEHVRKMSPHWMTLAFASLMTLGEIGRSVLFNGFTSLSLGYALIDTPLAGYAPVAGGYALSWLGYYIAAWLGVVLRVKQGVVRAAVLVTGIVSAGFFLQQIVWVKPVGAPMSFRLVQLNVPQQHKYDPAYRKTHIDHLVAAIEKERADLIITPETAFPVFLGELPNETLSQMRRFSQRTGSHLFFGIATIGSNGRGHNSMVQINPFAAAFNTYHKIRLMPFGEYSPVGFGWFSGSLHIPLKDLDAGGHAQPLFAAGRHAIGTLICHEDLVGDNLRRMLPHAGLLINPSNLAWFDHSLALPQRAQIVRMRAIEAGRPILRVANTGITAHIDHRGVVVDQLPQGAPGTLAGHVQPMQGQTPYSRNGDKIMMICCILSLIITFATLFGFRKKSDRK